MGHRRLSPAFVKACDEFLERFGARGPQEMDIASPRYADDPQLALRQMSIMAVENSFDPEAAHQRYAEDRVVAKLRDGELVEVDGTQGTVRLLSVPSILMDPDRSAVLAGAHRSERR